MDLFREELVVWKECAGWRDKEDCGGEDGQGIEEKRVGNDEGFKVPGAFEW